MNICDLVSIVVPVHNGEEFLEENVRSILNQTYTRLEIIYVCDGCTDGTIDILRQYLLLDSRLRIHVEEQKHGAAAARNIGMELADGDWLIFLDSDDLFRSDMIEIMLGQAVKEQADMCCCFWSALDRRTNMTPVENDLLKLYCKTFPIIDTSNEQKYIFQLVEYNVWTKLIHKSVYKKKDVCFLNIPNGEDAYFSILAAIEAERIVYAEQVLVYYRSNKGRNTLSTIRQRSKNYVWVMYDKLFQHICKKEHSASLKQSFYNSVCRDIYILSSSEIFEDIFNDLYENYLSKWGMNDTRIVENLSYVNQEIYKRICVGDNSLIHKTSIVMQAKVHFVKDIANKGDCSIWGCGYWGQKLLDELNALNVSIQHVFDSDSDKTGKYISGKIVETFEGEWIEQLIVTTPQYYVEIEKQVADKAGKIYNLENEICRF